MFIFHVPFIQRSSTHILYEVDLEQIYVSRILLYGKQIPEMKILYRRNCGIGRSKLKTGPKNTSNNLLLLSFSGNLSALLAVPNM